MSSITKSLTFLTNFASLKWHTITVNNFQSTYIIQLSWILTSRLKTKLKVKFTIGFDLLFSYPEIPAQSVNNCSNLIVHSHTVWIGILHWWATQRTNTLLPLPKQSISIIIVSLKLLKIEWECTIYFKCKATCDHGFSLSFLLFFFNARFIAFIIHT